MIYLVGDGKQQDERFDRLRKQAQHFLVQAEHIHNLPVLVDAQNVHVLSQYLQWGQFVNS